MIKHEERKAELSCFLEQLIDLKRFGYPDVDDEIALTLAELVKLFNLFRFDVWEWLRDWVDVYEDAVADGKGQAFLDWVNEQPCCSG